MTQPPTSEEISARYEKVAQEMDILEREISLLYLVKVLDKTIKFDDVTKIILFLSMLGAFTEDEQSNVFVTGTSSVGKTWCIQQIAWYFKGCNLFEYTNASPKSFFYANDSVQCEKTDETTFEPIDFEQQPKDDASNDERQEWHEKIRQSVYFRDLERTIHIFYDQKNTAVQEELRSVLAHDQPNRIYWFSNVNKSRSGRNQNFDVYIKGNIVSIFASATQYADYQEITRNFQLSPEWNPLKEKAVKDLTDKFDSDPAFRKQLEEDVDRQFLRNRIRSIRAEHIDKVYIPELLVKKLRDWFDKKEIRHQPKVNRDYPRVKKLAKYWAMLNCFHRKKEIIDEKTILWCDEKDINVAIYVYDKIFRCAELGMSPEIHEVWEQVIEPNLNDNGLTVNRAHILYGQQYHFGIDDRRLRDMLKGYAKLGLCTETKEGRELKYYPISQEKTEPSEPEKKPESEPKEKEPIPEKTLGDYDASD